MFMRVLLGSLERSVTQKKIGHCQMIIVYQPICIEGNREKIQKKSDWIRNKQIEPEFFIFYFKNSVSRH